ncbi:LLM class flavin-dependent oxidoreductase [Actinoplanes rectilineatus]|uniref:LLM class flavin-dependent oxidoreductase n=1 Tax=Actinoplanes rectilineatus TaxID=113571 RepID=UPI0005F2A01C|nr:LLM class flavin-dependent oxidoreductase [Actinoplanes rectilineatus]
MTTLGAVFLPHLPPERLLGIARTADEAGLEELWLWEDCFLQGGIAASAAALAATSRLRIGIGILPAPLRNVALTAMELATLHRMFPGRLLAGVGHGVQDWMGQAGVRVDSPLTLLREQITALRGLLGGETVTMAGRYVHLDGVRLDHPPLVPVPILAGASGPRTLRLAAELADGVILTGGTTPEQVRKVHETVESYRRNQGRRSAYKIIVYLHAATGSDAAARLEIECARWGYPAVTDRTACGDAVAIASQVRRWAAAGAGTVVLQPTPDDQNPDDFVRFAAREVRPLVL